MARRLRARGQTTTGDGSASRWRAWGAADGEKGEGAVGILTEDGDGETTTGRWPAAEKMAATGTGGDGNGVPTTPDHGGAAAEGRQDLGKILERLGREIGDRSGEERWFETTTAVAELGSTAESGRLKTAAAGERGGARGGGVPEAERGNGVEAGLRHGAAKPTVVADWRGGGWSGGIGRPELAGKRWCTGARWGGV
uniref:Uncharacterized protein n=1 Tax=Oryza sativa subsp. japonica TaxID=39947 RepID=Q69KU5_ORYSJ|nr:hypothetical protein [Oryza sativa Japonica Group]BAD34161.1 hypothetical protein [Oryza sativa Japonica Group]